MLLVDQWASLAGTLRGGTLALRADAMHEVVLEYAAPAGVPRGAALLWEAPARPRAPVPANESLSFEPIGAGDPQEVCVRAASAPPLRPPAAVRGL